MPPRASKACRMTVCLTAFSLIELLVVMAIVMILAGMAVYGLSDSTQNARRTSRELVRAHLQQARAHAIATRSQTALIIPARGSAKLGLRAMSLIEVEHIDGRYVPVKDEDAETVLLQRWEVLPQNFHFVTKSMIEADQPTVVDHEKTLTIQYHNHEMECHMMVFTPQGQMIVPSSGAPIHIAIAQVARKRETFRIGHDSDHKPVFDLLLVNRLTAKTRMITP